MKKTILSLLSKTGVAIALVSAFVLPAPLALAADPPATGGSGGTGINVFQNCDGAAGGTASGKQICGAKDDDEGFNKLMTNIINTILFILGIIAVIMIIVGGIRYTTSNGDASGIKSAKDTIMYAVIGLVVAIMSYAIVNFVLARLGGNS